jgi:predicted membrane protein (TIGR00267 family)
MFLLSLADRTQALKAALVAGISAVIGSLIPLVPFVLLPVSTSIWVSIMITAIGFLLKVPPVS